MKLRALQILLYSFLPFTIAAQIKPVVYDTIPASGVYLETGWLYNQNDNPQFAQANYNDEAWKPIDLTQTLPNLPQLASGKIGWMRMHFKTGPGVGSRAFIFNVWQSAASEIYLDGKLVGRYGNLNGNPAAITPYGVNMPDTEIYLTHNQEHVLAVRIAPWRGGKILDKDVFLFDIRLADPAYYLTEVSDTIKSNMLYVAPIGIFFLLSLLHLAFYKYDPTQRANLYFSVYAFILTLGFLMVVIQREFHHPGIYQALVLSGFILTTFGGIWIVKALSYLFIFNTRWLMRGLWAMYAITAVMMLLGNYNYTFLFSLGVCGLAQLWLTTRALLLKRPGAGIIATGFAASVIAVVPLIIIRLLDLPITILTNQGLALVVFLAPAIGISVYLAREFAISSNLLRLKLVEVEGLSAQNLAHEQEKQSLLAQQNIRLEQLVTERTTELSTSLANLQSAQTQLIQAEKMASLGELTAGIAHEIQNPLNFVNNFSEVSRELLAEMQDELAAGNMDDVADIAADLDQNLEKINHHGKRAENIVKGMLEHSRVSTGTKQPTNINHLADEYLRLAYHGMRAKDKTFNTELLTCFDEALPPVSIIPQDIGRVLLNIYNNAFYALREKTTKAAPGYKPTIEVSTVLSGNHLILSVKDNGTGITNSIINKIMQPFFTTKPTGQGTGLGLSLSYDIIVKGHNGQLTVTSEEEKYTQFDIEIPV